MQNIDKIGQKLNKAKILKYSAIAIIIIIVAILINIGIVFPITQSNIWIYGVTILTTGFALYFLSLFLLTTHHFKIELVSIALLSIGEIFVIGFFNEFENIWISIYFIVPCGTFLGLAVLLYYFHSPELRNRQQINWGIMLLTASLFGLVVEAAARDSSVFSGSDILLYGIVIIVGGLILYIITTLKVFEKPRYPMALTGAFITNIGLVMIEIFFRVQDILFTLIFLPPAVVLFVLLLVNFKLTTGENHSQSASQNPSPA